MEWTDRQVRVLVEKIIEGHIELVRGLLAGYEHRDTIMGCLEEVERSGAHDRIDQEGG